MLKKLGFFLIMIIMLNLVVPITSQAQDDEGLSAQERALLERYFETSTIVADYEQYAFDLVESLDIRFTLSIANQALELESIEYLAMQGQIDNLAETVQVDISVETYYDEFEADIGYSLTGEARVVDEVIYVQANYTDTLGAVLDLPLDWQVLENREDVPAEFQTLGLEHLFEGNLGFIPPQDLLLETASQVTHEENTLPDGTPIEIVTILVEGENFATFLETVRGENSDADDFFSLIFLTDQYEGYVDIWVVFDAAGNVRYIENFISVTVDSVDFADLGGTDFPEGTTVKITADILLAVNFSDLNIEIVPIEAPIIGE